jgi:(2Fe-2S) ferredoxin/2-polyprenyl-3-methyl-5-hydroxy-6-metoxy-1,4-benzoquinol methylase
MEVFKYHVFVCTQTKPEKVPSCPASGSEQTYAALLEAVAKAGLEKEVLVTTCGCLGLCEKGPNLVVYPEGVWYSEVKPEHVGEIVDQHFKGGRPVEKLMRADAAGLKQEALDHFNKVKAMKAALAKSGVVPEELNSLMRGFMESRVMLTAIELDLFTAIGSGASAKEVAERIQGDLRGTIAVLNALVALKALSKKDDTFFNAPLAARFLVAGAPDDSRSAIMHTAHLWHRWSTLTEVVRKGSPLANVNPAERPKDGTIAFIAAMHKIASFRAVQVTPQIDLAQVNSVLDLGAGSGAYSIALARKKPGMKITAFDLPMVIPIMQNYVKDAGLEGKIDFLSGNMLEADLGKNYDLVILNAICHMFGPEQNLLLFKRVNAALNRGGRILIQDNIMNEDKTFPRAGAVFAINMLVNTQSGSTYSSREYFDWLKQAGFSDPKVIPLPGPTDMVVADKK